MADNENTFLNADNLYEEVEGEAGKNLALELGQKENLVGIIQSRFYQAYNSLMSHYSNHKNSSGYFYCFPHTFSKFIKMDRYYFHDLVNSCKTKSTQLDSQITHYKGVALR